MMQQESLVRAVPVIDELVSDDGGLVLVEDDTSRVMRLSALGMSVRLLAASPVTLDELADGLVERFGPPETGSIGEHVARLVEELTSLGILERVQI